VEKHALQLLKWLVSGNAGKLIYEHHNQILATGKRVTDPILSWFAQPFNCWAFVQCSASATQVALSGWILWQSSQLPHRESDQRRSLDRLFGWNILYYVLVPLVVHCSGRGAYGQNPALEVINLGLACALFELGCAVHPEHWWARLGAGSAHWLIAVTIAVAVVAVGYGTPAAAEPSEVRPLSNLTSYVATPFLACCGTAYLHAVWSAWRNKRATALTVVLTGFYVGGLWSRIYGCHHPEFWESLVSLGYFALMLGKGAAYDVVRRARPTFVLPAKAPLRSLDWFRRWFSRSGDFIECDALENPGPSPQGASPRVLDQSGASTAAT
jgi:hypothetical protein